MVTKLQIRNYRCLADVTLRPAGLTVLVGPNASGKSTILDVLEFVKDALRDSLPTALDRRGGIQLVRRRSHGHPTNVTVAIDFTDRQHQFDCSYSFTIKAEPTYAYSVQQERCLVELRDPDVLPLDKQRAHLWRDGDRVTTSVGISVRPDARRLCLPLVAAFPHFAVAYDLLTSVAVYSVKPDELREAQEPTEGQVLKGDGSNAASVLREIRSNRPEVYERLSEILSKVSPGVSHPHTSHRGRKLALMFKVDVGAANPWDFESFLMSDGTLRLLGILIALEQALPLELLGIEEPEATIHPAALATLVETIQATASHTQTILTTHSPDILDLVPIGAIQCVRLLRGRTVITPPSAAAVEAARQSLMQPGGLMRANILEPDKEEARQLTLGDL